VILPSYANGFGLRGIEETSGTAVRSRVRTSDSVGGMRARAVLRVKAMSRLVTRTVDCKNHTRTL